MAASKLCEHNAYSQILQQPATPMFTESLMSPTHFSNVTHIVVPNIYCTFKMSKIEVGGGNYGRPKSRHELGSRLSVLLSNPDYLLEGFAEKSCQFVGAMEDIPMSADMSDRGYLLYCLDNKRNSGELPWNLGQAHNVSITVSAYNVKITKDNRGRVLLHRIPIHEIASASYINDDNQHILFMKAGDASKTSCSCYIFSFNKRADAEEVCTILQQAFQLVYTEATMEHLNESISAGERGGWRMSRSSLVLTPPGPRSPARASPPKAPSSDGSHGTPSRQLSINTTVPTVVEETGSDGAAEDSVSAVELVQDYMERLHKLLDFKELREFATLLKQYREDLKVDGFLTKLMALYGEERKFLIPDMNSFIPEEDMPAFEKFLSDNNLRPKSSPSAPPPAGPGPAEGRAETSEVDSFLIDLQKDKGGILTTNF